jgi:GMP synthase-like glutamine amidotransferase
MKIGILRTDDVRPELVDEFGEYPDMFTRILHDVDPSIETVEYDVFRLEYPDDIDEVDAYLMTGSKASVYDDEDWIHGLGDFVQQLHQRRKKLIGICFGHQLVAHVLGGRTEKANTGWLIGVHRHELNAEGLALTGAEDGFNIICSHQDQVIEPADGATILAGSNLCPVAMCRIENHILTVQGHPEFSAEYANQLYNLRREQLGDPIVEDGLASLGKNVDTHQISKWLIDFIS